MKTTININGKDVEIELTKDQVETIKQASLKITDRLKTWEDACQIKGIDPVKSLPYPKEKDSFESALNGIFQMFIITELLCEGWEADYANTSQYKWYPYFRYNDKTSGFGFGASGYGHDYSHSGSGARLVFPTEQLAKYAGTQFISIFNKFLTK